MTQLSEALMVLKRVAVRFRALREEAGICLGVNEDIDGFISKMKERALILVALQSYSDKLPAGIDLPVREKIEFSLRCFATKAQQALNAASLISLGNLLDDGVNGKNDLERLIDEIEAGGDECGRPNQN